MDAQVKDALRFVLQRHNLLRAEDLPSVVNEAATMIGASDAVIHVVDLRQEKLVPFTSDQSASRPNINVDGTLAGRAYTDVSRQERQTESTLTAWEPLLDGTERLGVLELTFPAADDPSSQLEAEGRYLASLVAEMLVARDKYGDAIARTRRLLPMQLPAEMQWQLMPPLTFGTPQVVVSGTIEPAYEVGGDCFDYAVNGTTAHVAVIDAMGHGLGATLLATVAVGALRNARRTGLDLVDTVRSMDKWLTSQFGPDMFVTAIVAELDIINGYYRWVNAGHPPALLLRGGQIVKEFEEGVNPPLGLQDDIPVVMEERLEPGDRLVLYTDGVTEARDAEKKLFGIDRLVDFVTRAAAAELPAPETLRRLNRAILEHQEGNLQDDATTLLVEWLGDSALRLKP
ncbi:MAG TPA: PP2C family protein-serine/threonine phosphatase [Jiangellaceae bacterium]|nr:PP2C family protein-serine/threonine phosphatase [Jiangellaceae bacterium]